MTRISRRRWSALALMIGAVGCSAPAASSPAETGDQPGQPTVQAPTTATAPPPIASTTPPPTVPSTPPPTIATTVATTSAPTTTIDPIIEFQRYVDEYFEWLNNCQAAPADCTVERFLTSSSDLAISMQERVNRFVSDGFYVRAVESSRLTAEKVLMLGPDLASVTVCFVNADATMDSLGTTDSADDVVIDDITNSFREEFVFQRSGSAWRPVSAMLINRYSNEAQCLAAG